MTKCWPRPDPPDPRYIYWFYYLVLGVAGSISDRHARGSPIPSEAPSEFVSIRGGEGHTGSRQELTSIPYLASITVRNSGSAPRSSGSDSRSSAYYGTICFHQSFDGGEGSSEEAAPSPVPEGADADGARPPPSTCFDA